MAKNPIFILVAHPGERHEDVIPIGLFGLNGLRTFLLEEREEEPEGGELYFFLMKVNEDWHRLSMSSGKDFDFDVGWNEEYPNVFFVEGEGIPKELQTEWGAGKFSLDQLISFLKEQVQSRA